MANTTYRTRIADIEVNTGLYDGSSSMYRMGALEGGRETRSKAATIAAEADAEIERLRTSIDRALDLAIEAEEKSGLILNNVPRDDAAAAARAFFRLIAWLRRDKHPEWNERCDRARANR